MLSRQQTVPQSQLHDLWCWLKLGLIQASEEVSSSCCATRKKFWKFCTYLQDTVLCRKFLFIPIMKLEIRLLILHFFRWARLKFCGLRNFEWFYLQYEREFNTDLFPIRSLGGLITNTSCSLIGFGSITTSPVLDAVTVFQPQYCNATQTRAYCSNLANLDVRACSAAEGSPVVCINGFIDGILLNTFGCTADQNNIRLNYHSINDFRNWINETSSAKTLANASAFTFILLSLVSLLVK